MIRFLIRVGISIVTAALAMFIAQLILADFTIEFSGFLIAVAIFTVAQAILAPVVFNMARKHAPAVLGGVGLVSAFLSLLIASFVPGGLVIRGISTWFLATLIVWVVTALGAWLIPLVVFKKLDAREELKAAAKKAKKNPPASAA